ncbi:hypothetical protein CGCF415_v001000 [Colletotrichum fructicola]|uniref:Uncharacterized protein n=1 Tax=Colletotrichum fructicola (strain Nara gc5) TaxID=1213859 RepID=A0A7J6JIP4_COLFN|nr:hypothetical protein CGGC5_v003994 [Colletotrichum fructicola Nara gc5]KAF4901354.1 hypothetical protein CGCFRS4_v002855 [Colletotrichum fructicola]KAF4916030.1 hypothetical protein CGCF415_v001000 [Colletotrichum fructicola]KAF4941658.1 hypothetical protein CGCF245_v001294 [Colletotrichum fructicola]
MTLHQLARLAQSVERETLNLKVVGSTPTSGSIPVRDCSAHISFSFLPVQSFAKLFGVSWDTNPRHLFKSQYFWCRGVKGLRDLT